jgi:hypothetical protein
MLSHTSMPGTTMYIPQHSNTSSGSFGTPSTGATTVSPTKPIPTIESKPPGAEAILDASIAELETQLLKLKKYEAEFIALNLEDSRKMLASQVAGLEAQIWEKKREKSLVLIERLKREGFGGLAASVGKEVGLGID